MVLVTSMSSGWSPSSTIRSIPRIAKHADLVGPCSQRYLRARAASRRRAQTSADENGVSRGEPKRGGAPYASRPRLETVSGETLSISSTCRRASLLRARRNKGAAKARYSFRKPPRVTPSSDT